MTERDPRNDPKPGDVTLSPNGAKFTIAKVEGDDVGYLDEIDAVLGAEPMFCTLEEWRKWSAKDEIVQLAGE